MLQQAIALHQRGQLAEAAILYRDILAQNPENADALHLLGVLEAQRSNASAGIELIERAIRIQPNNAAFLFNQGNALSDLKRFDAALASYDRALALKPDYAEGLCSRGTVLQRLMRLDEALASYDRALKIKPDYVEALNNRGIVLAALKRFDEALVSYDRALAIKPDYAEALSNRGTVLHELKRFDEALASYDRAIAIKPDYGDAFINRGFLLHALKRFDEGLRTYDRALAIQPDHAEALNGRGVALRELKRFEDALESFDKALAIEPDLANAAINREMTLLEMGRLTRFPPLAARALFDDFSSHYDQTMLEGLSYRGHIHLRTLAERVLPRVMPPWSILDLGMGTGLVGDAFKDLAAGGRLDGIDLAPRMVEAARSRNIYDDLILGDLEAVLAEPGRSYDLILAADTMIYIGDLAPTFSGVVHRLMPGGFYIFACESKPGENWDRTSVNRFRHSEAYLRGEAARAGLEFIDIMECFLRTETAQPVPGFAVALRKPAAV